MTLERGRDDAALLEAKEKLGLEGLVGVRCVTPA